jgi:hypothetical protein
VLAAVAQGLHVPELAIQAPQGTFGLDELAYAGQAVSSAANASYGTAALNSSSSYV